MSFCVSQAKELLDHLEGVLSNKPVEIVGSNGSVEVGHESCGMLAPSCLFACLSAVERLLLGDLACVEPLLAIGWWPHTCGVTLQEPLNELHHI